MHFVAFSLSPLRSIRLLFCLFSFTHTHTHARTFCLFVCAPDASDLSANLFFHPLIYDFDCNKISIKFVQRYWHLSHSKRNNSINGLSLSLSPRCCVCRRKRISPNGDVRMHICRRYLQRSNVVYGILKSVSLLTLSLSPVFVPNK